jgi:Collagen triple helix repeat (20 copies)
MFNRIHQKLGTAGFVIAIVALVAALGGGAYAASGGLTGKQKKEVEKIAKKYAGMPGAPGANGANGTKGDTGAPGPAGPAGNEGLEGKPGPEGKQGSVGPAGPTETNLPPGKTETGAWSFFQAPAEEGINPVVTISYPLRTNFEPTITWVPPGIEPTSGPCKGGTSAEPTAEPGNLCIYGQHVFDAGVGDSGEPEFEQASFLTADFTSGLSWEFAIPHNEIEAYATGSWALTAFNE